MDVVEVLSGFWAIANGSQIEIQVRIIK